MNTLILTTQTNVMAGLVPATPIILARPCPTIGVAGTSPAMTAGLEPTIRGNYVIASPVLMWTGW